jgi:hypothetical protein
VARTNVGAGHLFLLSDGNEWLQVQHVVTMKRDVDAPKLTFVAIVRYVVMILGCKPDSSLEPE